MKKNKKGRAKGGMIIDIKVGLEMEEKVERAEEEELIARVIKIEEEK